MPASVQRGWALAAKTAQRWRASMENMMSAPLRKHRGAELRRSDKDGCPHNERGRVLPAGAHASTRHRPASDRPARQRLRHVCVLRVDLAMSARTAGRVRARRGVKCLVNHPDRRGRHYQGRLPRSPRFGSAGPVLRTASESTPRRSVTLQPQAASGPNPNAGSGRWCMSVLDPYVRVRAVRRFDHDRRSGSDGGSVSVG